jgi:hypothetical protein
MLKMNILDRFQHIERESMHSAHNYNDYVLQAPVLLAKNMTKRTRYYF